MDPPVTVIPPDKVMPEAMETGVVWPTVRLVTLELASTSRPELASEVLTLPTVIEVQQELTAGVIQYQGICVAESPPSAKSEGLCSKADRCYLNKLASHLPLHLSLYQPDWVSAPEIVSVSSTSSVPPLIETDEASVPASSSFMDPPVTVIPPDKVIPDAMETGVVWPTVEAGHS